MNTFDFIVIFLIGFGFLSGLFKGFIIEVARLLALVLGIFGAFQFSNVVSQYIGGYVDWSPKLVHVFVFLLLFAGIVYLISLLAKMLTKAVKFIALGFLNRLLGGVFGGLKWVVIVACLFLIYIKAADAVPFLPTDFLENSFFYDSLSEIGNFLFHWVFDNTNAIDNVIESV